MNDTKLDNYLSNIRDNDNIQEKITSYKRANRRISTLKTEYTELCNLLQQDNSKKKKKTSDLSIDDIMGKLDELEESTNTNEISDIKELIENFIEYKKVLDQYDAYAGDLKNNIFKVNNDCTFEKIELDDLIK